MPTSLLLSQDMMSTYPILISPPKHPQSRVQPASHFNPSKITSENQINQWLSQQYSQRSYMQQQQSAMSRSMNNINTSLQQHHEDDMSGYTINTEGPDLFGPYMFSQMPQSSGSMAIQPARLVPSPAFSDDWQDLTPFTSSSGDHALALQTYLPSYIQESNANNNSSLYNAPRTAVHMSPSGSDHSLSPMYPSSPHLPTPTTPGSTMGHSPSLRSEMSLLVLDNQGQGHSTPSDKGQFTHRQQLVMFREVISMSLPGAGPFVPQQMYKPHTTSDRKRYVEEVLLEAPLYFHSDHPSQCGISLKDALQSRTKKLKDRDQVVFEGRGPSVSIRLEWPGYRQWSRQIPTKDFRSPPGPITLAKLAKNVAKCVQRFMLDRKALPLEEDSDPRWRIGDGSDDIKLEDLMLVSIHHVSLGSWQPHLRLIRPRSARFGTTLPPTPISTTHTSPISMPYTHHP